MCAVVIITASTGGFAQTRLTWNIVSANALSALNDDDINRHSTDIGFFDGLDVSQSRFSENGFTWHLIRFTNVAKPTGPMWVVPHDNENAAFEAMIAAIRQYGGVGIAVNSGPGSMRMQPGKGRCGAKPVTVTSCDPNRNFTTKTMLYTQSVLDQRPAGQPVIALHTNAPGFAGDGQGGEGHITILDRAAFMRGQIKPRTDGYLALNPDPAMANYDTLALTAYLARDQKPVGTAAVCGNAMTKSGVHFWYERVTQSDGSLSQYVALERPDIRYLNAESRAELDLSVAAARHHIMIAAYLSNCK